MNLPGNWLPMGQDEPLTVLHLQPALAKAQLPGLEEEM